ncbi:putative nuclear lamin L1 alpha [Operophtera brumata]|uniref:Putative nuclear lamin L1 alpha n=1 Tax=Operophtera brumata TaxID=104452 RepID=A0A0L7LMD0_OPEBR|nr:putative nuclear lamin L1 alpha [Operophtera brumata]
MEIDRASVMSSVQPTLRTQRNIINTLNADLDKIMMELKLTKSSSNVLEGARTRETLIVLLKEHEKSSAEVKEHRGFITELNYLLKQVQKEIKGLRGTGTCCDKEVRELQRQLDHSLKLEEFLRTKGTVRLTAADAKAEAKRLEQQEAEMRAYNNYEFAGEDDVDKLIQEFTRREEENYALFNYINEVCSELKNLSDNVNTLSVNIGNT